MLHVTIDDFKEYLDFIGFNSTSTYISGIKNILRRERIPFDELVRNIAFFTYKYKYLVNDLQPKEKRDFPSYLRKVGEAFEEKAVSISFRVQTDRELNLDYFRGLDERLFERSYTYRSSVDRYCSIKIEEIKKGSLILTVLISLTLIAINARSALNLIESIVDSLEIGAKPNFKKERKNVIKAAVSFLEIANLFLGLRGEVVYLNSSIPLTVELIAKILEILGGDE